MRYLIAAPIVLAVVGLAVGAVRGRVQVRSCCAADPRRDYRMRAAFQALPATRTPVTVAPASGGSRKVSRTATAARMATSRNAIR
jgi:hypothetical protein